jgi:signal transduction histidine kinase
VPASHGLTSDFSAKSALAQLRVIGRPFFGPVALAFSYFIGAHAALFIGTLSDRMFAPFWPPNIILFCALVIAPQRRWWLYIAAAFPAHVIVGLGVGMSEGRLLLAFAANCTVALLNAYGVRRFVPGPPWLGTFHAASLYIVITTIVSPAVAGLVGAFGPIIAGGALRHYWTFWSHWYLSNALPSLTLGPMFLIWFAEGWQWPRWSPSVRQFIAPLLAVSLVGVCILSIEAAGHLSTKSFLPAVLLVPLPLILIATMRSGVKGASGAVLIATIILIWRALHGPILFPGENPEQSVIALQLFLLGLSVPALLLGALIDELRRGEETTRRLTKSLLVAQDEERRRIARELHDSTGQNLIGGALIAERIEAMLPAAAMPLMRQLEDILQQSIKELRTVSYLLHPPFLDEAGLEIALRHYVEGYGVRSGVAVELEVASDLGRLPPETEVALFRIVQEALANVARHANSPTATVSLARTNWTFGPRIELTIEDEGRGILLPPRTASGGPWDATRAKRGVGLASMRERIEQIGGRLEIYSVVGRTSVKAIISAAN